MLTKFSHDHPDGPNEVLIEKANKLPVGEVMLVQPGSTTELQCSSQCFPACLITWFYQGTTLSTNASISFTPVIPPYAAALSCIASNPVTGQNGSAMTTVEVPGEQMPRVGVRNDFITSMGLLLPLDTC